MPGADLGEANLEGVNLSVANLARAYLGGANLTGASLWGTNLEGANLGETNLTGASLWGTNLEGANLGETNLTGADLWGTNLTGAEKITQQQISQAKLCNARIPTDLSLDPNRDCEEFGIEPNTGN